MTKRTQFIGIDCGRSAVKVIAHQAGKRFSVVFPAAVIECPRALAFDDLAEKTASDTVEQGVNKFWVGQTALDQGTQQGQDPIGRSDDWVTTRTHDVIVLSAIQRLNAIGFDFQPDQAVIVVGAPSRVAKNNKDIVRQMTDNTRTLLSSQKGEPYIHAMAQPVGVIMSHCINANGEEVIPSADASFLVVDVGQYTTDFAAISEGVSVSNTTDSCEGVEAIANYVRTELRKQNLTMGVRDLHRLMEFRKIKARGAVIDLSPIIKEAVQTILAPKIISTMRTVFGENLLQSATAILVAGGGAPEVVPYLKEQPDMPHTLCVEEFRTAVADGYAKVAIGIGANEHI